MVTRQVRQVVPFGSPSGVILALLLALTLGLGPAPAVRAADIDVSCDAAALIAAIDAANSNGEADTLNLAAGCTYTLIDVNNDTDGANGLPSITSEITLNGNGATIERSGTAPELRIFHVSIGGDLTLNELTVSNGFASDAPFHEGNNGGGIYNRGTMALSASTVSNNSASINGGGIFNRGAGTLTNSAVSGNSATQGGIFNQDGTVTLVDSSVNGNSVTDDGGGILTVGGKVTLINSTVSNNSASDTCGGIFNHLGSVTLTSSIVRDNSSGIVNSGAMTLTNSTVSGNSGSGIYNTGGTATLSNSTVSDNRGGGIRNYPGTATLINTIVADQRWGGKDCGGDAVTSWGHNLDSDGTCGLSAPGDLTGDPMLGPLQDNGGRTKTHALLPGSPAIDGGDDSGCPATDQRGATRSQDGDGDGLAICDMGAYELQPLVLNVRAYIDGRSRLIVRDDAVYWHHYNFAAPGRHFDAPGGNVPTYLNGTAWCPSWPGDPPDLEPCVPVDNEARGCNCDSSSYIGIPPLPPELQAVGLEIVQARHEVNIVQHPNRSNDHTLIVEFDDNPPGGPDWYEVNLLYLENPTSIDFLSFAARPIADRVLLAWETGSEVDNAGFNLWRSEAAEGAYAQINEALIPAEGDAVSGASYSYTDGDVVRGVTYYYKLEDVDIYGVSTFHGPVWATPGQVRRIYLPLVIKR